MPPSRKMQYEASPGELYRGITAVGETFEGETKTMLERDPEFVLYCKRLHRQFPGMGKGAVFSEQHKEAIDFLGWKLNAEEFMAAIKGTIITAAIPAIIILIIIYLAGFGIDLGNDNVLGAKIISDMFNELAPVVFLVLAVILFGIIGAIAFFMYKYPIAQAEDERTRALTYVPEMVGYLIMSMKLVPNLEKAIEFSAKHGKGKVADDFKRLIWDFQIGVYSSISEGLDLMAVRWGKYSSELKESLMKIRASVMEPSESKRYQVLDKTMVDVLESVKGKMEDYARGLNQPSVMLFYIGVLLPLLLVIILPVGSAFSNLPFATVPVLAFIYILLIPGLAYNFAKGVVKKRPPTYEPPHIDDNFAGLPRPWSMRLGNGMIDVRVVFVIVVVLGFAISAFLSFEGLPPKDLFGKNDEGVYTTIQIIPADKQWDEIFKERGPNYYEKVVYDFYVIQITDIKQGDFYLNQLRQDPDPAKAELLAWKEKIQNTSKPSTDPTKYIFWSGAILTLVFAFCIVIYYRAIYKRQAQLQIIQMEDEFKESMYMIASRMGENKPVESALKQAKEFLPNLLISKRIFGKTVENIELMGLPLETAVFDPVYGAMKGIPSKILTTAMRLLVDSVNLGVEVASRTLMSLSLQMENMDKVNKSLKDMVSDVTTTMQTMAIFIAPMVLGITTALQKVVMTTLSSVVAAPEMEGGADVASATGSAANLNVNSFFKVTADSFKTFASPLHYLLIIGAYVVLVVIILTYFTTKIKEDNDLLFRINLAKSLPFAMIVYIVTTLVANIAISSIMG